MSDLRGQPRPAGPPQLGGSRAVGDAEL